MLADYLATHELAAEWREQIHVSHRFNFERDVMALLPSVSNQWEELAPIARAPFSKCWFEHAASDHPGLTERWEVPEQHPFKEYGPPDDRVGLLIEEIAPFTIAFTTFFSWRSGAFARIPLETRNVNEDPEKHSHWSVVAFASFMLLNTKNSVETVAITHNNKKRARHGKADIDQPLLIDLENASSSAGKLQNSVCPLRGRTIASHNQAYRRLRQARLRCDGRTKTQPFC
jgi:hypothetical protein